MKVFRSVFALRLAIFPLVLNLTFSEEILPEDKFENSGELSEHLSSFVKEGDHVVVEDLGVVDDENPHPDKSGSSFQKGAQENDSPMDSSATLQNDEEIKNPPVPTSRDTPLTEGGQKVGSRNDEEEKRPPFDKGGAEPEVTNGEAEGFNTWDNQKIPPLSPLTKGGSEWIEYSLDLPQNDDDTDDEELKPELIIWI